jgi:predicted TIM-barrel fold metal-dependent hydrolase
VVIDVCGRIDCGLGVSAEAAAVNAWLDSAGLDRMVIANWAAASEAAGGRDLDEVEANLACRELCGVSSRLLPAYWVRPGRFDSHPHVLAGALTQEPFVAAVFAPLLNDFSVQDHQLLGPYLKVLPEVRRPAFFHLGPDERASVANTLALMRRYPATVFVLTGLARLSDPSEGLTEIARGLQRDPASVYVDTAGLRAEQVAYALEALGPGRLLFGSGVTLLSDDGALRCRQMLADVQQVICVEDFALVAGRSAAGLFGLQSY